MKFYKVKGEVAAGYGPDTVFDRTKIPIYVVSGHLIFEDWLGSDLLKISPVHYVTDRLAQQLNISGIKGIESLDILKVEKSENFLELHPNKEIPRCKILRINGKPFQDDLWLEKGSLYINQEVYNLLQSFNMSHVTFEEV